MFAIPKIHHGFFTEPQRVLFEIVDDCTRINYCFYWLLALSFLLGKSLLLNRNSAWLSRVWAYLSALPCIYVLQLSPFFLEKRTTKKVTVAVTADKEFLHGAGPSFDQTYSANAGVPLKLEGTVYTRAYVMGQMLKNKFSNNMACTFSFTNNGPAQWKVQQLACIYASS